jgi:iron-sulfur cluster assembly accessory protein
LYAKRLALTKCRALGVSGKNKVVVQSTGSFVILGKTIFVAGEPASGGQYFMISITPVASTKVKEIMTTQSPVPTALRVAVVGGGCSGFQYHMAFENQTNETDEVFEFDGLKVAIDQMSSMYLDGVEIDYIETIEGAGFKFNNPNVKSTCGCGSSFSV